MKKTDTKLPVHSPTAASVSLFFSCPAASKNPGRLALLAIDVQLTLDHLE